MNTDDVVALWVEFDGEWVLAQEARFPFGPQPTLDIGGLTPGSVYKLEFADGDYSKELVKRS